MKTPFVELPVSTHDGQFVARYSEKGLAELNFPSVGRALVGSKSNEDRSPRAVKTIGIPVAIRRWHRATAAALKAVLAGRAAKTLPPLDWSKVGGETWIDVLHEIGRRGWGKAARSFFAPAEKRRPGERKRPGDS